MEQDEFYEKLPENYSQPGIFELIKRDTLKKMGKLSKEATIQKALLKAKFIRDSEIPMPQYDPTALDEMPLPKLSDLTNGEANAQSKSHCPNSMVHCRLGCVCDSVNCQDMYDEYYEKHCRDTGDPECMYGCICENPGPHILNGESKWITSKPYKYKRPRVRDDEDCGFVPIHMREQLREGRPKRKAQAPTRYRPDFSISEKEMRAFENGTTNGNGISKRTSRPRRRLCDDDDDGDGSDDSDERIISDKKKKTDTSVVSTPPKKGRPTKLQVAARQAKTLAENLREPSKRERKPRNFDLPEPEPKRKRPLKRTAPQSNKTPSSGKNKAEVVEEYETMTASTVALGTKLHVIDIQPASKTCQGMYAVIRKTSVITTFVSWDEGLNSRPYLQDLKYKFTSSRPNQAYLNDGNDILFLPYFTAHDTMWLFYSIKKNFVNWDTIICPDLHTVMQADLLLETIEKHLPIAMETRISRVVDISHLNMNKREEARYCCRYLYLFFGKYGDIYWFGTPPPIYVEKNIHNAHLMSNALVKRRQHMQRRVRSPLRVKAKAQISQIIPNGSKPAVPVQEEKDNVQPVKNENADNSLTEIPVKEEVGKMACEKSVPVLTTPEVLPPSPVDASETVVTVEQPTS